MEEAVDATGISVIWIAKFGDAFPEWGVIASTVGLIP
jgi:flagellar motor component MotA